MKTETLKLIAIMISSVTLLACGECRRVEGNEAACLDEGPVGEDPTPPESQGEVNKYVGYVTSNVEGTFAEASTWSAETGSVTHQLSANFGSTPMTFVTFLKNGDKTLFSGEGLCGTDLRRGIYFSLESEDGIQTPYVLGDKCDGDNNVVFVFNDVGSLLTEGFANEYGTTTNPPVDPTEPTTPAIVNPGTGSPVLGPADASLNITCTTVSGVSVDRIWIQTLSGADPSGSFSWSTNYAPNTNYAYTVGSLLKLNVELNGAGGGWAYVAQNNAKGRVNTEQVSCVASLPGLNVAYQIVADAFWVSNGASGGDANLSMDANGIYDGDGDLVATYE